MVRFYERGPAGQNERSDTFVIVGVGGARILVEVSEAVADALDDMQRETWRIDRREARHTLSLDAMDPSIAVAGPEADPATVLLDRCGSEELAFALARLPEVQLRRLLMHAVARLSVKEIARCEGCSERAVKYSLARARRRMRELLTENV